MAPELCTMIAQHYRIVVQPVCQLDGGEECEIWRVASEVGSLVVRISPDWRSLDRLRQTHRLLLSLQSRLPVVVAPLKARDKTTFFLYRGQYVVLFPYREGQHMDRENPAHRLAAARLLAALHRATAKISYSHIQRHVREAPDLPGVEDAVELSDPELDAWHAALLSEPATYTCGIIHGDYYRRNILVQDDIIVAVLDWDDAHPDFLMQEVAYSTWEFCKTAEGDDWYPERAQAFLRAYREAGGPCRTEEYASVLPFIRWRLREEIRYNLAAKAAGLPWWDDEYVEAISRAFQRLRNATFVFA